jgi:hypothetical protein
VGTVIGSDESSYRGRIEVVQRSYRGRTKVVVVQSKKVVQAFSRRHSGVQSSSFSCRRSGVQVLSLPSSFINPIGQYVENPLQYIEA